MKINSEKKKLIHTYVLIIAGDLGALLRTNWIPFLSLFTSSSLRHLRHNEFIIEGPS